MSREVQESEVRVISDSRELLQVMDQLTRLRNSSSYGSRVQKDITHSTDFHLVYVYSSTDSRQVQTLESVSAGFARDCVELTHSCYMEYSDDDYDDDDYEDREECTDTRLLFYGVDINKQGHMRFLETLRIMRTDCFYVYRTTTFSTTSTTPSTSEFIESFTLGHATDSAFDMLLRHLVQRSDPLVSKIHCWQNTHYRRGNTTVRVHNDVHDLPSLTALMTGMTSGNKRGVSGILFSTPWIDPRLEPLFCQGENTIFDRVFQKMLSSSSTDGQEQQNNVEMDWISLNGNTNDFFYYTLLNTHHVSQYPALLFTWHNTNKTQLINFNLLCTRILQKHGERVLRGKLSVADIHCIEQELAIMFQHCVLGTPPSVASGQDHTKNVNCSWFFE